MNTALLDRRGYYITRALALASVLLPLVVLWIASMPYATAGQRIPAGNSTVYLPLVARGEAGPPPPPANGALYLEKTRKTASASVMIDARGGMHAALVDWVPLAEQPAALYRYCPGPAAACVDPTSWRGVRLSDQVEEVQMALTPTGQPRLLIQTRGEHPGGSGKEYRYAACDSACDNAQHWTITMVTHTLYTALPDVGDSRNPQRYFALDRQGRPGFVFYDRNFFIEPDRIGVFFATCASACASSANWSITAIGSAEEQDYTLNFERPSLSFTSQGQPRIVSHISVSGEHEGGISFIGCDADCDVGASWQRVTLYPRGQGSMIGWDIALDQQDRPRIAAFPNSLSDGSGEQLYYFWCNGATMQACLNAETDWSGTNLGLGFDTGQQPDLALDAQGRPRIAWIDASGNLGYTWCHNGCESAQPNWQYQIIETPAAMKAANPQALPITCDQDVWEALTPVLALDPAGYPRIAYDVSVEARCSSRDPNKPNDPPTSTFVNIWRGVRVVLLPQP